MLTIIGSSRMATVSFFKGFEIKDKERVLKVLMVLQEEGKPINLSPEERELLKKQEEKGKEKIDELVEFIKTL
jgi:hypothetical protein